MAKSKFDWDRGIMIMRHNATGMLVGMYFDQPGVYLQQQGHPVPDAIAREAGFDVERFGKERVRRERMATAMTQIEAELAIANDPTVAPKVLYEAGGLRVVEAPLGNTNVVDEDGQLINTTPLSEETARKLVDQMTEGTTASGGTTATKASGKKSA